VNRFAKYAAQRTLPGVTLGILFGSHAARTGDSRLNKRNEAAALIAGLGPQFLEEIMLAYSLGEGTYDARLEKALAAVLTHTYGSVELAIRSSNEKNVKDAVRPAPMTSLRDVEAGVSFWADQADANLLTFVRRTKD
jgi:hypothetical protein